MQDVISTSQRQRAAHPSITLSPLQMSPHPPLPSGRVSGCEVSHQFSSRLLYQPGAGSSITQL